MPIGTVKFFNEERGFAVIGLDEAVALRGVEPLDGAAGHVFVPFAQYVTAAPNGASDQSSAGDERRARCSIGSQGARAAGP